VWQEMDRMLKGIPIGVDDFKTIKNGCYFVDKSLFIKEIIDDFSIVKLITRPRRFGKTLNLSMLKYFLKKQKKTTVSFLKILKYGRPEKDAEMRRENIL